MRYLHTMVRVADLEASLDFYVQQAGHRFRSAAKTMSRAASPWSIWPPPEDEARAMAEQSPELELDL